MMMPSHPFDPNSQIQFLITTHFDSSDEAVLVTDGDVSSQRVVYSNPAFSNMVGWSTDEMLGKKATFMQGPKTNRKVIERLKSAISKKKDFRGSTINYRKNGEEYFVEWNIHYFEDSRTGIPYFISVQHDLTKLKKALDTIKLTHASFKHHLKSFSTGGDNETRNLIFSELKRSGILASERIRRARIKEFSEIVELKNPAEGLFVDASCSSTTAREYLSDYYIDSDCVLGIRDILDELDSALQLHQPSKNTSTELAVLFGNLAANIFSLEGFVEVSSTLTGLASSIVAGKELESHIIGILESLIEDLTTWNQTVFVSQDATDIHALDQSIIGSANQIMLFLSGNNTGPQDLSDVELF